MAGKKQYYKLDEIGFVGTQDKGTPSQIKKDIEEMVKYVKAQKNKKKSKKFSKTK